MLSQLRPDELLGVCRPADGPISALEVAIYIEEATSLVIPDSALTDGSLVTPESALATVNALIENR